MRYIPSLRRERLRSLALGHRPGHASVNPWKRPKQKGRGRKPRCKK